MKALAVIRPVLLVIAPFLLALGLILPLVRFETLYFFDQTPSLVEIVVSLWQGGDRLLAAIVGLVSIVLPILKMVGIAAEATGAGGGASSLFYHRVVPHLSKWSMMDVLLVAIVIAAAKTTGVADAFTPPGLWCYAASSMISGLLHSLTGDACGPK
ncbi:paraquat-inducible protein A [Rhizobium binae]|uniref:Paraquat-inducible protein A n=1 Tax=Rhizobium binae TaxID=1138190 RepID=A0ABV2MLE0_9HYPH|nr:paraquat-inducible protein A [Rhizobium binae]MBX4991556.1 paraquat-inducible protein A [Rhizobium binae]NKL49745.1 paraquat-inducible protein A [Rhizobium leguminosarum bv. viciae]